MWLCPEQRRWTVVRLCLEIEDRLLTESCRFSTIHQHKHQPNELTVRLPKYYKHISSMPYHLLFNRLSPNSLYRLACVLVYGYPKSVCTTVLRQYIAGGSYRALRR